MSKQRNRGHPDLAILLHMSGPAYTVRLRAHRGDALVKALQRAGESAPKPKRPKRECPLRIRRVIQRLPYRPLLRRIAVHGPLLRYPFEECHSFRQLLLQRRNRVVALDLVDVFPVERSRFRFLWSTAHCITLPQPLRAVPTTPRLSTENPRKLERWTSLSYAAETRCLAPSRCPAQRTRRFRAWRPQSSPKTKSSSKTFPRSATSRPSAACSSQWAPRSNSATAARSTARASSAASSPTRSPSTRSSRPCARARWSSDR